MTGRDPHEAFLRAVEPLRAGVRLHCYRMLGSTSDSDDAMQDVLLRAFRAHPSLGDPALVKPWLYRIATNVCLDELKRRPRRALASDIAPAAEDPCGELGAPLDEPIWLEPVPTAWSDGVADDPAARLAQKESVGLAFVAAIQALTPLQRAALLLRDVVGFSAEETAAALELSVASVNAALFRARSAVEARGVSEPKGGVDEALLARYIRAWETSDADAIVALLRDEVATTMPPRPTWIAGRAANEAFYRHMFTARGWVSPLRIVRTSANGAPALAFYRAAKEGEPFVLRALQVLDIRGGAIARIDHFMTPAAFPAFDLPPQLGA